MDKNEFKKAVDLINKSNNVLVTTHSRPDGDACGCIVAMAEMLKSAGKNGKIVLPTELPEWYAFMFSEKPAVLDRDIKVKELMDGSCFQPDLILIIDTNSYGQLGGLAEYLKQNNRPVLIIDHHITNDGLGDVELVDTKAAAAGLIVFDLLKFAGWNVSERIAESLFVAIATDTGWFRFASTDGRVHRSCAELIDKGVKPAEIYHRLFQSFSLPRFRLMTMMLNTLKLHFDGRYAEQHLLLKDFEQTQAAFKDTENLIDECQRISSVEVSGLFVEMKDGKIKCSLRSRGGVDVRKIAQKFGGGGHREASGLHLAGPLEHAKELIKTEIEKQLG